MLEAVKSHWREYLMEAWGLGTFMVSACVFGVILGHPDSSLYVSNAAFRGVAAGVAMGATAVAIFLSPWGMRSGAHINPAVTLTFWRLGKVGSWDAVLYIAAQFLGAAAGVLLSWSVLGETLAAGQVNFVVTLPGGSGAIAAFAAEAAISFCMMTAVLVCGNSPRTARLTPYLAGFLVAVFISVEAPFSGMSMNPARSLASALAANVWTGLWIYFVAPPLAMLLAAETYLRVRGAKEIYCAKLNHGNRTSCIFKCRFNELGKNDDCVRETSDRKRPIEAGT